MKKHPHRKRDGSREPPLFHDRSPKRARYLFRCLGRGACAAGTLAGRILGRLAVIVGAPDSGRQDRNVQTLRLSSVAHYRFTLARTATTARGRRLFLRGSLLHGWRDDRRLDLKRLLDYRLGSARFTQLIRAVPTVAIAAAASLAILSLALRLTLALWLTLALR